MTVQYTASVATNSYFAFIKLLFRWKGSIYRHIWPDFIAVFAFHLTLTLLYSFFLNQPMKEHFKFYCQYCQNIMTQFPIHFVLGFFVDTIASRWWTQFQEIPWPDDLAMSLAAYTHGNSEYIRKQRRTIMRYINLAYVLALRDFSSRVRLKFPSEFTLVQNGLATEDELVIYNLTAPYDRSGHYSVPITWAQDIILQMRNEDTIKSDITLECLLQSIRDYRKQIGELYYYDMLPIPLVYTQVATILTYFYMVSLVFAWQFMGEENLGIYVPTFGLLQFFFYMGWLKVVESLINPFGMDEDDFDVPEMIERNVQISYDIVDDLFDRVHPLSRGVVLDTFAEERRTSFINHLNDVTTVNNELFTGSLLNLRIGQIRR